MDPSARHGDLPARLRGAIARDRCRFDGLERLAVSKHLFLAGLSMGGLVS
jgi:hypothetical protein